MGHVPDKRRAKRQMVKTDLGLRPARSRGPRAYGFVRWPRGDESTRWACTTVRLVVEDLTPGSTLPVVDASLPYPEDYFVGSDLHDDQAEAFRYFSDPSVRIVANRLLGVRIGPVDRTWVARAGDLVGPGASRYHETCQRYLGGQVRILTHVNVNGETVQRVIGEIMALGLPEQK
jgi:hypothetical protein